MLKFTMTRLISGLILLVVGLMSPGLSFAQSELARSIDQTSGTPSGPSAGMQCGGYYTIQAIAVEIAPNVTETVQQAEVAFVGSITNNDTVPLSGVGVMARVILEGEGGLPDMVVDELPVAKSISVAAAGQYELNTLWKVPTASADGTYHVKYLLVGMDNSILSTTKSAPFKVVSGNVPVRFAGDVKVDDNTTVQVTVRNSSDEVKNIPLQWNQYTSEVANEESRVNSKTQLILLTPKQELVVTYEVKKTDSPYNHVTVTLDDGGSKSITHAAFLSATANPSQALLGLQSFPLKAEVPHVLFGCINAPAGESLNNFTAMVTVSDREGNILHTFEKTDIGSGYTEEFIPAGDYDYVTLTAQLYRDGVLFETVTQVFDCAALDQNTCLADQKHGSGFFEKLLTNSVFWYGILTLLVLLGLITIVTYYRRRHVPQITAMDNQNSKQSNKKPFLVLLLLFGASLFFTGAPQAEANGFVSAECEAFPGLDISLYEMDSTGGDGYVSAWSTWEVTYGGTTDYYNGYCEYSGGENPVNCSGSSQHTHNGVSFTIRQNGSVRDSGPGYDDGYLTAHVGSVRGCALAAAPVNNTPNAPSISGATTGTPNTPYTFTVTGTDPDDDQVRYGVDWNNNGVVDEWLPSSGHVNSGTARTVNRSWSANGNYSFQVLTQDELGLNSTWTTHTIQIAVTPPPTSNCTYNYVDGETIQDYDSNPGPGPIGVCYLPAIKDLPQCGPGLSAASDGTAAPAGQPTACKISECEKLTKSGPGCNPAPTTCSPVGSMYLWNGINWDDYGMTTEFWSLSSIGVGATQPPSLDWTTNRNKGFGVQFWGTGNPSRGANTLRCSGAGPVTTADLKINGSDTDITTNKNTPLNLTWNSANASACTLYGAGLPGGSVAVSGNTTINAQSSDTYILSCDGAVDAIDVTVTNQAPNPPTIVGATTGVVGTDYYFDFTASDSDGDDIVYGIDLNMDRTVDTGSPYGTFIPSGTTQNIHVGNWSTPGTYTIQAQTRDIDGATSAWSAPHRITISLSVPPTPPSPSVSAAGACGSGSITASWGAVAGATGYDLQYQTSPSGAWTVLTSVTSPRTLTGLTDGTRYNVQLRAKNAIGNSPWSAYGTTNTAAACPTPTATINASNCQIPTGGSSCTADVTWSSNDTISPVSVRQGNSQFSTAANQAAPVTRTLPYGLNTFALLHNNGIEVTSLDVTASCVTGAAWDSVSTTCLPDPGLVLTATPTRVKAGQTISLTWNVTNPYAMTCTVRGPGMTTRTFNPLVSPTATEPTVGPITAKSTYTLTCTSGTASFSDTVTVESQGVIEEI